jgi:signal transduction histidine kinase/uncharacterized PurR-regulated membrane protein YhhQ (DUF165 family)
MVEAIIVYFLVLGVHSLRRRYGIAPFYALLGGITAAMSWVTDAGLAIDVAGIRFVVGSTVFYTSLLLGVFVIYVFDGPRATRLAISTVAGVSVMMPLIAAALHVHVGLGGTTEGLAIPQPSLRINAASVAATLLDLVFLGIAWEFLGRPSFKLRLWLRTWLTLLGVMWLDVFLFATGAFAGTADYLRIMQGTLLSRFAISLFALPFLYAYIYWQSQRKGIPLQHRPLLAVLREVAEMEEELSLAEQEIARRERVELALRESKSLLDATGELANVGGWRVDLPSMEFRWTEETRRICEVPPGYVPTLEKGLQFFHPDDRETLTHAFQRAVERGEPYDLELRFITAKGKRRWIRTLGKPHVVGSETVELLGAFQDITERKSMEKQLRQQERMAAVGQMASGIAHDFRNRVNAIMLYAEMALDRHELPDPVANGLDTIIHESRGIADLVQQILDFSGRSMVHLRPIELGDLIQQAATDLRRRLPDDVQIAVDDAQNEYVVEGDRERLLQALRNLASNASDAMPEGGTLTLALARVDGSTHPVPAALAPGAWIRLSVSDTGTGMTEEVQQHLFEPFFTTKDIGEGTGLGLAQVFGIVRQHEGILDVETELGRGTAFHVYLPAYAEAAAEVRCSSDDDDKRATVLLVEPNESLRHAERELLASLGYRVLTAKGGRDALAVNQSPRWTGSGSNHIDLLVTALEMPRMTGEDLVRRLKTTKPYLKAVVVSGRALEDEERASLHRAGFDAILYKPLDARALEGLLRGKSSGRDRSSSPSDG